MSQLIHYKGIEEERMQDAPFIGALLLAVDCHNNCPGCFNQYLRNEPTLTAPAFVIMQAVKSNPFHQGIILGGLEWTEQPQEMIELIVSAKRYELEVMLYTHYTKEEFLTMFPVLRQSGIYVKFGEFKIGEESHDSMGVTLASNNQYIEKL